MVVFWSLQASAFEIGAHRGMYPPLEPGYKPGAQDCTAEHIDDPSVRSSEIRYILENTLLAISKAFEMHADRASINLQLTGDEEVVLFHDKKLDCKTDRTGFIRDYDLKDLKTFNMGAGYQFDGAYPWRETRIIKQGYTEITTLDELMAVHPDRAYWIVVRPKDAEELAAILRKIKPYSQAVEKSLLFVPVEQPWVKETIARELPEIAIPRIDPARNRLCQKSVVPGQDLSVSCHNLELILQVEDALALGPHLQELGERLHEVNSHLVIGTDLGGFVETVEQAKALLPYTSVIDGMMTNRIDLIGPFFHNQD